MKKIKVSFILTTLVLIASIVFVYNASLRFGNTIFNMNDKKYDDYGVGNIKYPKNLEQYEGLFDVVNFKVIDSKDKYYFEYKLSNIENQYEHEVGFSNVVIDTYISVGEDGLLTTSEYGAAVTFNEDYPWVYHIKITPDVNYVEKLVDKINKISEKLESTLSLEENTITISVNKNDIKEDLKKSKYYVFTGGFDILGSDNYREVVKEEDEWNFYGGIDSLYQPNVLDVVSPVQERMLKYFMPPTYTVLSPVYNQIHQLIFKKELLYGLIAIFFAYKYSTIYKSYKNEKNKKDDK